MGKVILYLGNSYLGRDTKIFSSRKKLLEYFQLMNPEAKSLRVKDLDHSGLQVLNHNTPICHWRTEIEEIEIDNMG